MLKTKIFGRKAMSLFLSLLLIFAFLPVGALISEAESSGQYGYDYTGSVQTYTAPKAGYYQLEAWGAQGGAGGGYVGGYGGYSTGVVYLAAGQTLYIYVGGAGSSAGAGNGTNLAGGYNGGGASTANTGVNHQYGSGGGATHIATTAGLLSSRASDYTSTVLIVAGGGGGGRYQENYAAGTYGYGGCGGGYIGQASAVSKASVWSTVAGATQTSAGTGGSFGQGAQADTCGAGGGGLYGGGTDGSGSGGSGYLNPSLISCGNVIKHMTMFDNTATDYSSANADTRTNETTSVSALAADNAKTGNGYARVTQADVNDYTYTGGVQTFTASSSGYYQLETWGAQGGSGGGYVGGYGGYATGVVYLAAGQTLYIYVGGAGSSAGAGNGTNLAGGYNGGGASTANSGVNHQYGSGGGATHIATTAGLLSSHAADYTSTVLIVSGGGGGGRYQENYAAGAYGYGGCGGGYIGQASTVSKASVWSTVAGATQTAAGSGGSFGQGASADACGAGGGGLYGGGTDASGSGGSGYLNPSLISSGSAGKHMAVFDNTAADYSSSAADTKTIEVTAVSGSASADTAKSGAGYARITKAEASGFTYSGGVQTYSAPYSGYYQLEAWGAQGGSGGGYVGGYGGYSTGVVYLTAGQVLYIYVGGAGSSAGAANPNDLAGGYNGGGASIANAGVNHQYGSGGGATHIATTAGLLSSHASDYSSTVLIVAGGGGGGRYQDNYTDGTYGYGGCGGGYIGQASAVSQASVWKTVAGATQTAAGTGGSFGQGAAAQACGAGGGGLYGGGTDGSGSGGSGYLNPSLVSFGGVEKHMALFDNTAADYSSSAADTRTYEVAAYNSAPGYNIAKTGSGYASVTLLAVSVTLDSGWGAAADTAVFDYKNSVFTDTSGAVKTSFTVPQRTGYVFAGYKDAAGVTVIDADGNVVSSVLSAQTESIMSTKTLTASWTENTYSLNFDAAGGVAITSETLKYSQAYTLPATTRSGYTFAGWILSGNTYAAGQSVSSLTAVNGGSVTLTAQWTANTYYVAYDGNGQTGGSTAASTFTYDTAGSLNANGFTKTGYTFSGWNTVNDGSGTAYADKASVNDLTDVNGGTVTLYAQWTENSYNVVIDPAGGTPASDGATLHYTDEYTLPTAPGKQGYTFSGWSAGGSVYAASAVVSGLSAENGATVTVTAQWTEHAYTLSFDCAGGSPVPSDASLKYTDAYTLPAAPAKTGYTFAGWKNGDTVYNAGQSVTGLTADDGAVVTMTAQWTPVTYTVSYDANGGTGAPTAFTATFDQTYYAGAAPTKTGYTFTGWLGSNGTAYQAGDELKNLVTADGGSFTLTAQWEINHYDVRFFNYDDTQIGETQSVEYGKDATAPADPTRLYDNNAHYTFNGWTGYTNITAATDITAAFTAAPHSYTYAVKIAPTADAEGLLAGTCTCGKTVTVDIPVLNDTDYTVTTTAATPDAAGNTHYVWNENVTYGVNVTGDIAIPALGYTVSFYKEDGTTLIQTQHADTLAGAVAAYDGALPAKDATAQYTYTFDKWVTTAVDEAAGTYKAVPTFTSTVNKYTVTFKNYDGTVIDTQSVDYGSDATAPAAPVKPSDETNHYTFDGWTGYTNITKNTEITATFTAAAHSYTYAVTTEPTKTAAGLLTGTCACGHTVTVDLPALNDTDYDLVTVAATTDAAGSETYSWRNNDTYGVNVTVVIVIPKTGFTVSFYDESGVTLLDTKTAATLDDALAAYAGETQTKAPTAQYTYTFAGWTTTATDVNNGLYKAVAKFDETTRKYTVTFKNDDGTVLDTQSVAYGSGATAPTEPTKAATAQYSYTFAGWDKTFDNITGDLTVTASYTSTVNTYTVTYYNNDGTVLYTAEVPYGSSVTYAGTAPSYVGEDAKYMEFAGWSVTTDNITGVTSVKAVYKDTGSKLTRFFDKLIALIVKIRELLIRITEAHGNTYDVNIWTGGKWQ